MPAMSEKDYQADSDLRTLIEAEKIRKDKSRLAAVMRKHKELMAALENVQKGK